MIVTGFTIGDLGNIRITSLFLLQPASLLGILTRYSSVFTSDSVHSSQFTVHTLSLLLLSFGMINNPVRMDVLRLAYRFLTS